MNTDKMQGSRFELKYIITEDTSRQVRDFVRSFLELDENSRQQADFSYSVHSLYLDSDNMKTYWDTINGNRNRFKLRLRFYHEHPDAPVFFEIKRRVNHCIMKQRGGVRRPAVSALLAGLSPSTAELVSRQPKLLFAVQEFCRLTELIQAKPKVHVAYRREAYMPADNSSARLTLDRAVQSEPESALRFSTRMANPVRVWGRPWCWS